MRWLRRGLAQLHRAAPGQRLGSATGRILALTLVLATPGAGAEESWRPDDGLAQLGLAEHVPATGTNFGGAGLIEMRSARFRPDGTLEFGAALQRQRNFYFGSFQALPFLETTFRLADRLNGTLGRGRSTDRSFDLKLRLLRESEWLPQLAIGVQDVIGTGLYAGEYVVASKRLWDVDLTLGLGWGRLGTGADLGNPLGLLYRGFRTRPRNVGQGGLPNVTALFRGRDVAVFGGVEWTIPELSTPLGPLSGLRAKLELSGDALRDERGGYPARTSGLRGTAASRVNVGLAWQPTPWMEAGVSFVHGSDLLVRLSLRLDPAAPPTLFSPPAPPALGPRFAPAGGWASARPEPPADRFPQQATSEPTPAAGQGGPARSGPEDEASLREAVFAALSAARFRPEAFELAGPSGAREARIAVSAGRQPTLSQVAGRVQRAVQAVLPEDVETLRIEWRRQGLTVARLVVLRQAMEAAAIGRGSAEEVFAGSTLLPAGPEEYGRAARAPALALHWGIEPRLTLSLGDPQTGVRWQAGIAAGGRLALGGGFAVAGSVQQTLAGNLDKGLPSNSLLPHVRSDLRRYARESRNATIPALYFERLWNPAPDWFARASIGLLEPMFGGVSAEALWRPAGRGYALGIDFAFVAQRDYRQRFRALGYSVATGHASAYAELPWWNLYGVVRAGRYLAGDWGGTLELGRRFDNGIEVGGFATFTNVRFSRFGEGSFDKGIYLRFPLQLLGTESAARVNALVRPVQRDGGQRLAVDSPLWDLTREGRAEALGRGVAGFLR